LVERYSLVAIVSGRPSDEVEARLGVPGVRYEGLYGLDATAAEVDPGLVVAVREAVAGTDGVRVEDKGASVAVHYRQAAKGAAAREPLMAALADVVNEDPRAAGYEVVEGKMVLELLPAGRPRKGGAVERLVAGAKLRVVLYAGDDVADIEAFEALERLAKQGIQTTAVAVEGRETPQELIDAASFGVAGPTGLLELLVQLA